MADSSNTVNNIFRNTVFTLSAHQVFAEDSLAEDTGHRRDNVREYVANANLTAINSLIERVKQIETEDRMREINAIAKKNAEVRVIC
jgi:hypothetical protein